jgi:hypothetical protein
MTLYDADGTQINYAHTDDGSSASFTGC